MLWGEVLVKHLQQLGTALIIDTMLWGEVLGKTPPTARDNLGSFTRCDAMRSSLNTPQLGTALNHWHDAKRRGTQEKHPTQLGTALYY